MESEVRKVEAEKLQDKINQNSDLVEIEEMIKNNYIQWEYNGAIYKVRKPTFGEQQELRKAKIKKHSELRSDNGYKYEKQIIIELKEKGISIASLVNKQIEIGKQIEELQLQLAKFGNEKEGEVKAITDLKLQIYTLMTERNNLALEKMEYLSDSIENELLIFVNSYACSLVLEKKEGDNWIKVFKTYEDFVNCKDDKLVEKASFYLSKILFKNEEI